MLCLCRFTQTHWSVSHRRNGKLPGQHSSTISVGSIRLYHVSAHLPTCLCWQSSQQTVSSSDPCCSGVMINDNSAHGPHQLYWNTWCFMYSRCTQISVTRVQRTLGNDTYIATIISRTFFVVTISVGHALAHLNEQ